SATATAKPGDSISDTATLSGATATATGGMTFTLYGPFDASTAASGDTCVAGNLVTTLGPVAIGSPNGSGNYVVSSGTYTLPSTLTNAGGDRYQWIASYSGDGSNASGST